MSHRSMATPSDGAFVDRVEPFGMLFWKIGVLAIALRFAIFAPIHPATLAWLLRMDSFFHNTSLVLFALGLLHGTWQVLVWAIRRRAGRPASRAQGSWWDLLRRDWAVSLGVDCALAAMIIPLSLTLAIENRLDWYCVGWLALIALARVVLHDLPATPKISTLGRG
jgi:hypothetical protein